MTIRRTGLTSSTFVLEHDAEFGKKYGVQYAEGFHYIGPEQSQLDEYIKKNAVPISR